MRTATGGRCLDTDDHRPEPKRWRLASYVFLIALMLLAMFEQKQASDVSILATGPLPAINIP